MVQNFEFNDRRVLTFWAVHPCEDISLVTLMRSLISLSQKICSFQSKFFATQRRNARETEITDREMVRSESVVLSLSDLHITFQKVQCLLEDCTREGARLWMLMKSQLATYQFQVLIRAVATALDVLPLSLIEVCGEVKELVELVAKHARKVKFELDPEDELALKQVNLMLDFFQNGTEPEASFLKRFLDYLEIRKWSSCNKEIQFLEEEIRNQSHCDQRHVPLLNSLLGLMTYCRVVMFETTDYRDHDQSDVRCSQESITCLNPKDFHCPISLELMTDPVTISTGQTYDRSSIQKWLKAGNTICPKTGERLSGAEMVPNISLRKLIQQFCSGYGISVSKSGKSSLDITRTIVPGSTVAAETMKFLSRNLARRLVFGSNEQQKKAAYEIRLLAKSNIFNRSRLIEAGTILPLLNLLSSLDASTQENSIAALLKLSKHTSGKRMVIDNDGLRPILAVLSKGLSLEARQIAAATLFYIASVKGYRKYIGEMPEAVPALVELIKTGTACGKKNAVVAIFGLLLDPGNHRTVLESGIVPFLIEFLSSSNRDELKTDSLVVLAAIADRFDGALEILQTSAIPLIIRNLQSIPQKAGKEYCASILLSLCKNGGLEVIEVLAKDPFLMSSLYSLLTEGTSHASSKARALIKVLHKFHETRSSRLKNSEFRRGPSFS
ncbi:hypothetical protein K2173_022749 [Erythroxylum novogranatense]|uniref:RING-type E3 ubiquitin transferase n=1 Tax=Erythroxylum novogranatense TaxID=1862640 RepID=A0AAV8SMT3_9ROSI|nr:hypothetical protein K2173_022749 [Erythroxylum novogranatense]